MGIVWLGYHGSTETIRETAKNNEESISERLVQAIEGKRENIWPPENKKQGKKAKNKNICDTRQNEKGEKSNTEKRRGKTAQLQKKKKRKREANNSTPREKKEKKRHEEKKKNKKVFSHLRLS